MSTRTGLRPAVVLSAGDMSLATVASTPTVLQSLSRASYTASWTGTSPVGVLALQASNDYTVGASGAGSGGTWVTLTTSAVSGNTGGSFLEAETGAYAVRLLYTKTSGTGSLTATVAGKV